MTNITRMFKIHVIYYFNQKQLDTKNIQNTEMVVDDDGRQGNAINPFPHNNTF